VLQLVAVAIAILTYKWLLGSRYYGYFGGYALRELVDLLETISCVFL
jgi:hypothetical protein